MPENTLYYGDNLDVLRRHIGDETVDLIYIDPPFNSNATYNVLFAEQNGKRSAAQIKAFTDTWQWNEESAKEYALMAEGMGKVSDAVRAFYHLLGQSNMMAYLAMMAPRLVELHRVLKSTGSFYLHCDPTASHYLKVILDTVFGPDHFISEIVWKRTSAHSDAKAFGNSHDIILFYRKSEAYVMNKQYQAYSPDYIESHYRYTDEKGRRYRTDNLTATSLSGGGYTYEWHGVTKIWRCPITKMQNLDAQGRIHYTRSGGAEFIRYLDEMPGLPAQDIWDDITPINSQAAERLGYPTQKPESLLDRIIQASSNPGDVVLDAFCGCGTAISSAQKLGRRWIGIDITHLAIGLIRRRMKDTYGIDVNVVGEPTTPDDAHALSEADPYQFQWWALGLVGARPVDGKKGSDTGIDGRLYFHDEGWSKTKEVIISVKAGKPTADHIRVLQSVVEREKAQIGVLICMHEPTKTMRAEAAGAGFYESPFTGTKHPRIQILTIEELFDGKRIDVPIAAQQNATFKQAPKNKKQDALKQSDFDLVVKNGEAQK